jgi:hypothetical protein
MLPHRNQKSCLRKETENQKPKIMYKIIRIMLPIYRSTTKKEINSLDRTGEEDKSTKRIETERQRKVEGEIERG